ncbi:37S ribosomal protein S24-like protein [Elsinoe fawcettii]|nr:37S ribosomal protein S24-like protein [Elsinoe fawcettii]
MAGPASSLCRQALRLSHRTQWLSYRRKSNPISSRQPLARAFSTTISRTAQEPSASEEDTPHFDRTFYESLSASEKSAYLNSSPSDRRAQEELHAILHRELGPNSKAGRDLDAYAERYAEDTKEELGPELGEKPGRLPRVPEDFSTMADPDPEIAPDEEFQDDDISSLAHGELDQHRELREFMRLASWEMPLLSTLTTPFSAPTATTPLRWRYTTYLGTPHPAANKVVLSFNPSGLGLTPAQTAKLIKLAGPRYSPHDNLVKMSSESFPSQAQNKRYLGDTLAKLIAEAKDQQDPMEDIPFDFRHAKENQKLSFPKEWRITNERKQQLEKKREEARRALQGEGDDTVEAVDGIRAIEEGRYKMVNELEKLAAQGATGRAAQGAAVRGRGR